MSTNKYTRIARLSVTFRFPSTFRARLASIPDALKSRLTASEIAVIIDNVQRDSFSAGYWRGQAEV